MSARWTSTSKVVDTPNAFRCHSAGRRQVVEHYNRRNSDIFNSLPGTPTACTPERFPRPSQRRLSTPFEPSSSATRESTSPRCSRRSVSTPPSQEPSPTSKKIMDSHLTNTETNKLRGMCSADGGLELKGGRMHNYAHRNYTDVFVKAPIIAARTQRAGLFRSAPKKNEETMDKTNGHWQPTFGKRTSNKVAHQPTLLGVLRPEAKRPTPKHTVVPPFGICS